jgi:autotransporter-associated beta strand protein
MKNRFVPLCPIVASIYLVLPAHAVSYFWDGTSTTTAANGGNGNWDTTTTNWDTLATAGADIAWPTSGTDNDAVFGGTAGTVAVDAGGVIANDITFNTANYILQGGKISLNGTTPTISNAVAATINSEIAGTAGLSKTGAGALTLGSANTFTGNANISGGSIVAAHVNALTTATIVNISTATGAGTLRLATDSSVGAYKIGGSTSNQGTIIADRATAGVGFTHALGTASLGSNTYNFQAGGNVTSGTAGVSFSSMTLSSGAGGTTILNPTSAALTIVGGVSSSNTSNKVLELGGTNTGNLIGGTIVNGSTTSFALTKSNTSTWELAGANSYSGATNITGGTLQISNASALGATATGTTVSSGATLSLDGGIAVGAEALNLTGNGVGNLGAIRSISGINSMSGAVTLAGGTRIGVDANTLEMSGAFSGAQALTTVGAGKLILSGGGAFGQMIVGNSAVASGGNLEWKAGTGTAAGQYFGVGDNVSAAFTVSGGSLTASPTSSLFVGSFSSSAVTGTMNVTGGTYALGTNVAIYVGGGGYNGNVSGSGILNISGGTFSTGTTTATFRMGANVTGQTGNGEINLSGTGILQTARSITKGAQGTASVSFDGGTYKLMASQGTMFGTGVVTTVKAGGATIDTNAFNGTIGTVLAAGSPSGGLTKQGAGTLTLSNTNTYTGVTTINGGTISVSSLGDGGVSGNLGAATSDAANIVFGGGALQYSAASAVSSNRGFTITAASSATFNVSNAAGALTLTGSVPTTTGVLYKTGSGSLTLDPGAISQSLGAISANGGELILKSGTYTTTAKDGAVSAYNAGAGARGGTLTIDGATLNVGGTAINLKIAANGNGNLNIKSGAVSSGSIVIGHNGIGATTQSGGTVTTNDLYHQDAGTGSSYTLSGGSLTAKRIYNNPNATSGTFTLNLNGGNLLSANSTTNLIDNQGGSSEIAVLLGAGNTNIDTTASSASIVRPMGNMASAVGTFTKVGTNTLTLTATNTYTGATTITGGTLALSGTGSIANSSSIIVGASTTFDVSGVTGGFTLGSAQTLSGTGSVAGAMTVAGTLSPGNSPGSLATASQTWLNGGDFNWQILDATGAAGTGSDTMVITGSLDLTSLTAGGFNINLWSLASTGPDVSGDALNFSSTTNYSWTLASTTTGITGFDATDFTLNVGANNGTSGFSNALDGGAFTISQSGNSLLLNYTAVPEPSVAVLGGMGLLALLRRRRR